MEGFVFFKRQRSTLAANRIASMINISRYPGSLNLPDYGHMLKKLFEEGAAGPAIGG